MTTKEKILAAGEVLFAANGYDGTSMRDITEQARVNVAAVNYHFGSKENLLTALLDRIITPINVERIELLDEMESDGEPSLTQILTAFLLPDLRALETLRERSPALPRFVSRMYSEASPLMHNVIGAQFAELGRRFGSAFARSLPDLGRDEIAFRLSCVVGIVVYMFAGVTAPGMAQIAGDDLATDLKRLLAVTKSIMDAPIEEVAHQRLH